MQLNSRLFVLAATLAFSAGSAWSQEAYQPTFVDYARCAAVARVKAVNPATPPAEAHALANEAKRVEEKTREVGAAAGKTPSDINRMLRYQLQMMSQPAPDFPNLVDNNRALCVKYGVLAAGVENK